MNRLAGAGAAGILLGTVITVTLPWTADNPTPLVACPAPVEGLVGEITLEVEGVASQVTCPEGVPESDSCFHAAAWFNCYNVVDEERQVGLDRTVIFLPEPGMGVMFLAGVLGLMGLRHLERRR